jgi:hypothetical protein
MKTRQPEPSLPFKIYCSYDKVVDVVTLQEHPKNPNKHPPEQLDLISRVITSNGWRSPIVVSKLSGFIIKGHGRYQAAVKAGWTHVPVEYQEYLSSIEELSDLIADNKISELSFLARDDMSSIVSEVKIELPDFDFSSSFGLSEIEIRSFTEEWNPNEKKIDNTEALNEEAPSQIKVKCHKDQKEEIESRIEEILTDYPGALIA